MSKVLISAIVLCLIHALDGLAQTAPEVEPDPPASESASLKEAIDDLATAIKKHAPAGTEQRIVRCAWTTGCENASLYISGDGVSVIHLTGLPDQNGTLSVTLGEDFPRETGGVSTLSLRKGSVPETVVIAVHKTRWFSKTYDRKRDAPSAKELEAQTTGSTPLLRIVSRGESNRAAINITSGRSRKSFVIPVVWQVWWVDTGGFYAYSFARDTELVSESVTRDGQAYDRILQRRPSERMNASTGIVMNVHPGNYPEIAFQFGVANNGQRLPSYYVGAGVRLREVGRRALLTLACGLTAVQVKQYPGVSANSEYPSDSPLLTGKEAYTLRPYVSLSLGFSFGASSKPSQPEVGE
jgi:hypothetical protein